MKLSRTSFWAKLYMLFEGTDELPERRSTLLWGLLGFAVFFPFSLLQIGINYFIARKNNGSYRHGVDSFWVMTFALIVKWSTDYAHVNSLTFPIALFILGIILMLFFLLSYTKLFGDNEITWIEEEEEVK